MSDNENSAYEKLTPARKALVDAVMKNLENGVGLWEQGWAGGGAPVSGISGKQYNGINRMFLMAATAERGYSDNRWVTFKQMEDKDWSFKRDEEGRSRGKNAGVSIEYFELRDRQTKQPFDRHTLDGMTADERNEYMDENVYNNIDNIKNFRDNVLVCNHPILFNDPFEGILFAKGISEQESLEIEEYKRKVEKQIPSNKKSLFWTENSIVTDKNIVCCFVKDFKDNPFVDLMWAHYANCHFGFCIKFEFSENVEDNFIREEETGKIQIYNLSDNRLHFPSGRSEFKRVQYKGKPQVFRFTKGITYDSMEDFLQIKSCVWRYEHEVRLILHLGDCLGFDLNKYYGVKYDILSHIFMDTINLFALFIILQVL